MPRIYDSNGDPMDFCKECFPDEEEAEELYRKKEWEESEEGKQHEQQGNGGWGYDAAHPDYESEAWQDKDELDEAGDVVKTGEWHSHYTCETCKRVLRGKDNGNAW